MGTPSVDATNPRGARTASRSRQRAAYGRPAPPRSPCGDQRAPDRVRV